LPHFPVSEQKWYSKVETVQEQFYTPYIEGN